VLRNNQKNIIYILLLLVPFLLFTSQTRFFTAVKFGFIKVIAVPVKILSFPVREVKKVLYYHRTFEVYTTLRKEVGYLKGRLIGVDELAKENARLVELLKLKRELVFSSVAANVIGREASFWNYSITIDKGAAQGIKVGQPVVNALGVVGKVFEVVETTSKVILITDPQFSVAALAQRTRESGLVSGTLQGKCRMSYIDNDARIRSGDQVITSKLSSSFPESLLIGTIIDIVDNPRTMTAEAIIEPAADMSQLEEVLVVLKD
jgi:rod shape-determining protein MreC